MEQSVLTERISVIYALSWPCGRPFRPATLMICHSIAYETSLTMLSAAIWEWKLGGFNTIQCVWLRQELPIQHLNSSISYSLHIALFSQRSLHCFSQNPIKSKPSVQLINADKQPCRMKVSHQWYSSDSPLVGNNSPTHPVYPTISGDLTNSHTNIPPRYCYIFKSLY